MIYYYSIYGLQGVLRVEVYTTQHSSWSSGKALSLDAETSFLSCVDCSSGRKWNSNRPHPLTCYLVLLVLSNLPRSGAQIMLNEPLRRSVGLPGGSEETLFGGLRIYLFIVFSSSWALCIGAEGKGETQPLAWNFSAVLRGHRKMGYVITLKIDLKSRVPVASKKKTVTQWHGFSFPVS